MVAPMWGSTDEGAPKREYKCGSTNMGNTCRLCYRECFIFRVKPFRKCHVLLVCDENGGRERGRSRAASAPLTALSHAQRSAICLSPTQIHLVYALGHTRETAVFTC